MHVLISHTLVHDHISMYLPGCFVMAAGASNLPDLDVSPNPTHIGGISCSLPSTRGSRRCKVIVKMIICAQFFLMIGTCAVIMIQCCGSSIL
jgi:hypothetical protein